MQAAESTIEVDAELTGARPPERIRGRSWVATLVSYLVTVFLLITVNFALPRMMPGDPIDALLALGSPNYVQNDQTRTELARYYKLDGSIPAQYVHYLGGLLHGDLGVSIISRHPVAHELRGRVKWSLLLILTAAAISIVIGIPAGIHSGWKRGKAVDRRLLTVFLSAQNIPSFVIAFVALVVLSARFGVFPLGGATTPFSGYHGVREVLDVAQHLALPALTMGLFDFATYQYLIMRSSMVGELGADYLLTGRAKGLRERRLKYGYAGRNALLPVVTVVGLNVGLAVTSIVFYERIFSYPGVGSYMFDAIGTRDYPALQGSFLILTLTVVTTNFLVDLLYRRLDPRTGSDT